MSRHLRGFVLSVEGLTPEAVACIVAIGLVFGVFPIFWCPTILCTAAAIGLRLNLPAIHLLNQLATPLQFALLLPFSRIGSIILQRDSWSLRTVAVDAVAGWFCIAVPFGLLLYFTLIRLLRGSRRDRFGLLEAHTPSL